jgi:hypothetical protein
MRAPDALWRELADGVLLLSPTLEQPIAVLGPGVDAWDVLAEPVDITDLSAELARRYGIAPDEVRRDIEPVLAELARASLIVAVP